MTPASPDAPLVSRLLAGETPAFEEIVLGHRGPVYGYLRARLGNASDAEHLTRDVFLRFYRDRRRFDRSQPLRPWLLGIARLLLQQHLRAAGGRKESAWAELCLEVDEAGGPDDEALGRLSECLDGLPPSEREAIALIYRGKTSLSDIAGRLRRSEGAVKLLVSRARRALRHCLEGRPNPEAAP